MRKRLLFLLLLITSIPVIAQQTSLQGVTLNATTNEPVGGITVQLKGLGIETSTDANGIFLLENVPPGTQTIILSSPDIMKIEFPVEVKHYLNNDLGAIYVTSHVRRLIDEGSVILIEETAIGEDSEIGDFNVSSLMTSSNDVYISNTTFNFSAVRFRLRGYDNRYSDVYINGVKFNDPERGGFSYGLTGGLNDATRNKDITNYNGVSNYSFGQVGGISNINAHAGNYAPGGRASVAYTNRSYNLRAMATYSTGPMNNGWAITGSVGYRWADEGFIDGTFYNSLGYMLAIEKVINDQHSLSFTTLGSPTQRAQQSPNFQETMTLLDDPYYNSYWGYQDGKKRNSRIVTTYEPSAVLAHKFQINKDTRLTTSLGYKYTLYGSTALNWSDARDPRPDYYRNLPSYYTLTETIDDYNYVWEKNIVKYTQVDWDQLYRHNRENKDDPNKKDSGASYMTEERHNDQQVISLNSVLNTKLSDHVTLTAGIEGSKTKGMHYKTVDDLLGGDFFIDIDQFSQRDDPGNEDIIQNDMNNPNRKVVVGDRFGYDYDIHIASANAWLQNEHRYNKWDLYYGFKVNYTSFHRYGNMRNGRAPGNSYGKGKVHTFVSQSAKLGLTYKLSGRHIFSGNVSYSELPPLTYNSYVSVRTKDTAVPNLEKEKVFSADLAYNLTTPIVRGKVAVFQTNFYDQVELSSYYMSGSGSGNSYLNYAVSGINKMQRGIEAAIEIKLNSIFTASFAGTIAEYVYTNRPTAYASYENGLHEDYTETVYLKNFYVGGTPQTAGTLGLHAFYNYWFFDVNLNGFDRTYVQLAPNKRTEAAVSFTADSYEELETRIAQIVNQEKFKGGFTLDLSVGRSMRINNQYTLNINCQFNNILNNTELKTGGFEQGRFDYDDNNIYKFPNKYYYAQGFNMFLNVGLRF